MVGKYWDLVMFLKVRQNVMVPDDNNLVYVPLSLRARTSALDLWQAVIKWTKSVL